MRTGLSAQRITPLGGALLVLACLFGTTPSTYAGDGAATQAITGVGFSPEYVIIMGDGSHWAYNEELLKAEGKGIIAAFSPTGLSLNSLGASLPQVASGPHGPSGVRAIGRCDLGRSGCLCQTGAFPERLNIYHLLGDPALRLR